MRVRVFISSPGDVPDERTFAQQVVEQDLQKHPAYRDVLKCEAVRWDDPSAPAAMPATLTPQAALAAGRPRPSECDVVVVILWSRMGTPLPPEMCRPDGSRYLSGTEWEYEDAVHAAKPPHVLVYRRKTKLEVDPDDEKADEKNEQMGRVRQFLRRFRNEDGSLKGGFAEYDTPQQFRDRLRSDLYSYVEQRRASQPPPGHSDRQRASPPYGAIAQAFGAGALVPFIGPDAVYSGRTSGASWGPAAQFLPSGAELSRLLAEESAFPAEADREHLAEVASYYEVHENADVLRDRLRQFFGAAGAGPIPPLHALLASVKAPLLIVTTNYDTQLERAFHAAGKPYDLVVFPAGRKDLANAVLWWPDGAAAPHTPAPNELDVDATTRNVIFKMHGTIKGDATWDGVVITESDNVDFLARVGAKTAIPSALATHIKFRALLFLGFPLRDWNLRSIVRGLKWGAKGEGEEEPRSWAIADRLSELELRLWERSRVFPFELGLDEFAAELRKKLPR